MAISNEQIRQVEAWFQVHGVVNKCNICETVGWLIDIVEAPPFPVVKLTCKCCGHINLFDAVIMKISPSSTP